MDYYTQFSAESEDSLTDEEIVWLKDKNEEYMEGDDWAGDFQLDLVDQKIWIYADEHGNPDTAAQFIQEWLEQFHPEDCFAFEWAHSASRPAIDSFGGGAVFITAKKVEFTNTYEWVHQRRKEHQDAQAAKETGGGVPGQQRILEESKS